MRTMDTDLHSPPFFYWRPSDQKFLTNGAIVIDTNHHVYVIQASISREHGTSQAGVDELSISGSYGKLIFVYWS
jgi:hypothetical protein